MAQNYLQDRSWVDANWSTGTKPAANGEAYIPDSLNTDVDTTLDQGTVDLDLLWIGPGFRNNVGTSGTSLAIAADLVVHNGTGGLYYDASKGGGSLITDEIRIMCANNSGFAVINSESGDAADIERIVCLLVENIVTNLVSSELKTNSLLFVKVKVTIVDTTVFETISKFTINLKAKVNTAHEQVLLSAFVLVKVLH